MAFRFIAGFILVATALAEIPRPDDAPKPLPPAESLKQFAVPEGYQMRLLASEPLITEPSGICWDEKGRCFVCELHGYNLEGQYDIDELNKSGQLDLEVRRIQASDAAKQKAEHETYGTVKLLRDTDGDGVMDQSIVWADRLPPCHGIAAANGGIIIACSPHIVFLKDSDGDDKADVQEQLFTGFGTPILERRINSPTWGPDGWLYFGRGNATGTITGPHLKKPVDLPPTDFRIRADGTAIEPVSGSTKTTGMAFTDGGDRFVATTTHPGLFVTPIPWKYLARNPDAAAPALDGPASDDTRVYPIAAPHPWRTKREQHAEYFAFYRKISLSDAAASGYFTSACSPIVWRGQYFVCEPAQNLIHRADIVRDGTRLRLQRVKGEEQREFLASRDAWFHPIALQETPQGHLAIVDYYREIIEDYSAIPRHLQQQYGLINGHDRGRIWILEAKQKWSKPPLSDSDAKVLQLRENDDITKIDLKADLEPQLALQLALSVGSQREALLSLARRFGHLRWMDAAIACSAHLIEKDLLLALAADSGQSEPVMANLAGILAARGNVQEITECLAVVQTGKAHDILQLGLEDTKPLANPIDVPAPTAPTADQIAAWEKRVPAVLEALKQKSDLAEGKTFFTAMCASCHRSHGIGFAVGPDLDAEFQRAPEVILRDILFPSEAARPGYDTTMVKTRRGETLLGITTSDSPTSTTLKLPGGSERTVLRKRADIRTVRNVSLMTPGFGEALQPSQIANIIGFLRSR
ncbi:MAG: PVC-type heme-binding CxxCH protein [Verrucomicrobiaceae bacterium]